MRIRAPKRSKDGNVFDEAFHLLKQHFIDRSKYTENDWKKMKQEYGAIPDQHEGIRLFLRRFNDPYTAFYEPKTMGHKTEAFRGEKVTLGLSLGRKWDFRNLRKLRNGVEDSFKRLFSGDFGVISQHKFVLCRYVAASLTLVPAISSQLSNQLWKYTARSISPNLFRKICIGAYSCMILTDVIFNVVGTCCDVVVTECIGGAIESGVMVGDKVVGIFDGGYHDNLHIHIEPAPRQSIRSMRELVEDGPIDQCVYVKVVRDNSTKIHNGKSQSNDGHSSNENEYLWFKCFRNYR